MNTAIRSGASELRRTVWTFRRELLAVTLFSGVANLLLLVPTLYLLQVYDRVLVSLSELTLLAVSLIALFLLGVLATSEWARGRILARVGVRIDEDLGTRAFNAGFDAFLNQSSHTPARASGDLLQVRQFLTGQGLFALLDVPWTPVYITVIFLLHPWLGLLAILFAVVQAGLAWFGHRSTVRPLEAASKASADAMAFVEAKLRNAEVIASMGMLDSLRRSWRRAQDAGVQGGDAAQALRARVMAWSKFVRYTQQSLALAAGALLVIDGQLSAGAMIAVQMLMTRALAPIDQLVSLWRELLSARAALGRLQELLEAFPPRQAAAVPRSIRGEVVLGDVVATAAGRREPILKGVTFKAVPGELVAIAGPSGSGKSTLARTLLGIWPQVSGEVLLDGVPVADFDREGLGPQVGYLPQDVQLFEGTIAENIARMGRVDPARVVAAARATGLHEMILRFPEGYDTRIGEAGRTLSGGQRQRVGLARAIYGDPALVVLDEPNANLDEAGEAALRRTLLQLKERGSTVFFVTHARPGLLAVADRLLLLRDGAIQVDGSPNVLLAIWRAKHGVQPPVPGAGGALVPAQPA